MSEAASESAPAATDGPGTTADASATTATEAPSVESLQAEVDKWKTLSRKNEAAKKDNASKIREYETWKESQLSDHDKALKAAREEGFSAARTESAAKVASATFRAHAAGRVDNVDTLLGALDVAKFLSEDGEPDDDAIKSFVDGIAPAKDDKPTADTGLFQAAGARGASNSSTAMPLNGEPVLDFMRRTLGAK